MATPEYNNLPKASLSKGSKSFSIDDIEAVKSVKRTVKDNAKTKDNAFDLELNNAFGDEDEPKKISNKNKKKQPAKPKFSKTED
jgi:hypothetical protein